MSSFDVARLIFGYLSDQGLEETKNCFSKESPDLLGRDLDNHMNEGRKLSLIIKEYFKLKGNEKKDIPTDPENVLLSLWKQFDVLVGQLKHTTIHNSEKDKSRAKRGFSDQKARVRHLNKQNWVALQQKNKSLAANRDLHPKPINGGVNDLIHGPPNPPQCSPQPSINSQYVQIRPYPAANVTPGHDVSTVNKTPLWKTPTKSVVPHSSVGVLQSNIISESLQEVNSSQYLQSEQLLPSDNFKSPKRKSVPPKKRTGETVPAMPAAQISTKTATVTSAQTSVQEDSQLDIQNIVDKILGRPELSEKLAENINRAVEMDALTSQQPDFNKVMENNIQTQNAVVDRNRVDDIMEMMKSDPVFEELFSSFENFESCEESDTGQTKDSEPKNSSNPSSTSLDDEECANEALDALLLLASSPVRSVPPSSGTLETPQKCNASVMFSSPVVPSTSSVPVVLSPGGLNHSKRPSQPIMSHVRQLNFVGNGKTVGNGSTSQGTYSGDNTPASTIFGIKPLENSNSNVESSKVSVIPDREEIFQSNTFEGESSKINTSEGKISQDKRSQSKSSDSKKFEGTCSESKSSEGKNSEVISEGQVLEGDDLSREDVICVNSKHPSAEGTSKNDLDKTKENTEVSIVEEKGGIGLEKGVGNNPVVLQSGQKKSEGNGCEKGRAARYKDTARCSDETDIRENFAPDINMSDTERRSEKENTTSFNESPLKLSVLEDLATNELLQSKTVKPAETRVTKGSLVKNVDEEECNRTIGVILCEPMEAKGISTEPNNTSTEVSEELTSLTEGLVSHVGGFANIMTPKSNKTSGNDLSSSTESDKTSKRKLKKKKKSTRTSKKAKIIPEDLDVDKFLSSLHYVHEGKT
ncbi:NPAT isoform X2 [Paramuricea clavata]|uniref:NPAT isoform X2 n=1 Tax=Paramuricea clavata TaxID=317549 RepID=A0A7D9EKS9_PARCT|nr:NPAT isoform X2 [Paramuricea clavata]